MSQWTVYMCMYTTSGLECLAEVMLRDSGRQGSESFLATPFSGVTLRATSCDMSGDLSLDTECGGGVGWSFCTRSENRKEDKEAKIYDVLYVRTYVHTYVMTYKIIQRNVYIYVCNECSYTGSISHNNIIIHTLFKPCEAKSVATDMNQWDGTAYVCMCVRTCTTQSNPPCHHQHHHQQEAEEEEEEEVPPLWAEQAGSCSAPPRSNSASQYHPLCPEGSDPHLSPPSLRQPASREKGTHLAPPSSGPLTFGHSCSVSFAPFTHCMLQALT